MDVHYAVADGIATLQWDDGKKNALTQDALIEIDRRIDQAAEAQALVLVGRPGSFCAGFDIRVMLGDDPAASAELGRRGGWIAHKLLGLERPVVAACTGHAFTIGALWLTAADWRVGESGPFQLAMTETKLNVGLGAWPQALLEARINPQHLMAVAGLSRPYSPEASVDVGFLDEVVNEGGGLDRAHEVAAELSALPQPAFTTNKRALREKTLQAVAAGLG